MIVPPCVEDITAYEQISGDDSLPGAPEYVKITEKAQIKAFGRWFRCYRLVDGQWAVGILPQGHLMGGQTLAEALNFWRAELLQ